MTCPIDECGRPEKARGLPAPVVARAEKWGDPFYSSNKRPTRGATLEERFWAKVEKTDTCWLWIGSKSALGYGSFWNKAERRTEGAYRVSYEMHRGPIPEGLVLDHLCRNPPCVNPDHLEAVTHRENSIRGYLPRMVAHRAKRCTRGHAIEGDNLYVEPKTGRRRCLACIQRLNRARGNTMRTEANRRRRVARAARAAL